MAEASAASTSEHSELKETWKGFTRGCTQVQTCPCALQEVELPVELQKLECSTGAVPAAHLYSMKLILQ